MARTYSPLLSLDASGTIANSLTFSKWKGRNYVRTRVTPANPQSQSQWGMRSMMKALSQVWASLSAARQNAWEELADAESVSKFNAFVSYNLKKHRDAVGPRTEPSPTPVPITNHITTTAANVAGRNVSVLLMMPAATEAWLAEVFMDDTTGFTPAWSNCRLVLPCEGLALVSGTIGPLNPGTYYLRYKLVAVNGALDGTYTTEDTFTIV